MMNLPRLESIEDQAINIVVSVINQAQETLRRQTLKQLAHNRELLASQAKIILTNLECPLAKTSERLINYMIKEKWKLTKTFAFFLKYMGTSKDESTLYYYFEAIFSQPTPAYPIPQVTASVFFRIEDKLVEPPELKGVPKITFRLEGHRQDHDIRHVLLTSDRILGVMMMKRKLFQRIEDIGLF